jgi:hypothetical protein
LKYRRLTTTELEPLAEDFAIFLASNSIDKKDWDALKSKQPEKAEEILDVFSDLVFEKALSSAKYLERISEREITVYNFYPNQAHMLHVALSGKSNASFLTNDLARVLADALKNGELEITQGTKRYQKDKQPEMFAILQTGAVLSDGDLYQKLLALI